MYSKLLFLAKAASHKLCFNYPSDDDFYHPGHFGHTRSLPSPFKLSVAGQVHTYLSPTPSHPHRVFFFSFFSFFLCARQQHPSHGRCWADIKPAVFCIQARRVSRLISRRNVDVRLRKRLCSLGTISAPFAAPRRARAPFNCLIPDKT